MYLSSKNSVVSENKKWGYQSAPMDWLTWSHWIVLLEKEFDWYSLFFFLNMGRRLADRHFDRVNMHINNTGWTALNEIICKFPSFLLLGWKKRSYSSQTYIYSFHIIHFFAWPSVSLKSRFPNYLLIFS